MQRCRTHAVPRAPSNLVHSTAPFTTRRKNYPPGRFAIPILGDALWAYIREGQAHNRRLFAKHGPTFVDTLMGRRVINISRYEDIKKVLAAEHDLVEGGPRAAATAACQAAACSLTVTDCCMLLPC